MSDPFNAAFGAFHEAFVGKHALPEDIKNAALAMKQAHTRMTSAMMKSGHQHVGYMPVITADYHSLVMFMVAESFGEKWGVPTAWVLALPMNIVIDPATCYMRVKSEDVLKHHVSDGTVDYILYAAFVEGKEAGLIHEDDVFMFERDPMAVAYTKANSESLSNVADAHDLTADEFVKMQFGDGNEDWSFPA